MQPLQSYISQSALLQQIRGALAEDIGAGDVTTNGALTDKQRGTIVAAKLIAKADGILAGGDIFVNVCQSVSDEISCALDVEDSHHFKKGDTVAQLRGPASAILQAERTALNFLGRLSGVASLTARYVSAVAHTDCRILDTRKTIPGWRALDKYAVNCGGGVNHRMGLYDMALIKENHIKAAGSITLAVEHIRAYVSATGATAIPIEIEVTTQDELREALQADVNRVLLDNQAPEDLRKLVCVARELAPRIELEASGNVTLANVAEYAETGVDFISVGTLTHSAPVADFSLLIVQ